MPLKLRFGPQKPVQNKVQGGARHPAPPLLFVKKCAGAGRAHLGAPLRVAPTTRGSTGTPVSPPVPPGCMRWRCSKHKPHCHWDSAWPTQPNWNTVALPVEYTDWKCSTLRDVKMFLVVRMANSLIIPCRRPCWTRCLNNMRSSAFLHIVAESVTDHLSTRKNSRI